MRTVPTSKRSSLIIVALKFAEFPDHISIDYVVRDSLSSGTRAHCIDLQLAWTLPTASPNTNQTYFCNVVHRFCNANLELTSELNINKSQSRNIFLYISKKVTNYIYSNVFLRFATLRITERLNFDVNCPLFGDLHHTPLNYLSD